MQRGGGGHKLAFFLLFSIVNVFWPYYFLGDWGSTMDISQCLFMWDVGGDGWERGGSMDVRITCRNIPSNKCGHLKPSKSGFQLLLFFTHVWLT